MSSNTGFYNFKIIHSLVILTLLPWSNYGITVEEDLGLNYQQKLALDKFKEKVMDKLPHEYMKQDVYLIRWLRAKDFDVNEAEQLLMKNLEWRASNKMDGILNEDWSDMEEDYPFSLDSRDKEGRPVFMGEFGRWDLRKADVTGGWARLTRHGNRMLEELSVIIRNQQNAGVQITRGITILDMDGFNLAQHACSRCISYLLQFYNEFEVHYPGLLDQMFIINNHPIVLTVLQPIIYAFSPSTRKSVKMFNRNRDEYSQVLLQYINPDQLPERYGGTKK